MAVLDIRVVPDPVLRRKTRRVSVVDASIRRLLDDMLETMHYAGGVGLAANQVGVLHRVAVIQCSKDDEPLYLINPEVVRREGQREVEEGCLSIPGYQGTIFRSVSVRVKALDRHGKPIRIRAQDLLAQALEHEIDHLNGILYIDHLESHERLHKLEAEKDPVEAGAAS